MAAWHAIIPAGGAGTRLWPLSRQDHPKFLLDLLGDGKSLLQATVERVSAFTDSVTVVTGPKHYEAVKKQLPDLGSKDLPGQIIVEPSPRDSMAAISVATYVLAAQHGSDILVSSFAADHQITNLDGFQVACRQSAAAAETGLLATIGITPTEPSTAFGYIAPSDVEVVPGAYLVERFVEKPDQETAAQFVAEGYLWNAGMFTAKASKFMTWTEEFLPQMHGALSDIAREYPGSETIPRSVWEGLQKIAIDYALAEPLAALNQVAVVPAANLGWSDVGDFAALTELRPGSKVIELGGEDNVALSNNKKIIGFIDVDNVLVIEGEEAILVLPKSSSERVKDFVGLLGNQGYSDLL